MINCAFKLNAQPMSTLKCGASTFDAYSGLEAHRNKKLSICIPSKGPIPTGVYYIIDRQSGGLLGPLRDLFSDKADWFALYAIDKKIDDSTFCEKVKRGQFRIHPEGPLGISQGCVTFKTMSDFRTFSSIIKSSGKTKIPSTSIESYGKLTVL